MAGPDGDPERQRFVAAFQGELSRTGWEEGRNLRIDLRWGPDTASMQQGAKELVALQPDLILSHNTTTTSSLLKVSRTIPIIFSNVSDPVGSGFVESLNRPGGNVTGFTNTEPTIAGKWLELLKQIAPETVNVAFLFNPRTAPYVEYYLTPFQAAATSLALEVTVASVLNEAGLEAPIAAQARARNGSIVVMTDSFLVTHRAKIISMTARNQLPAVYPFRFFVEDGGLLAYGNRTSDNFLRAATYADRILNGASPMELPVQTPNAFELAINLPTAKSLGLTVPASLLARADQVIE